MTRKRTILPTALAVAALSFAAVALAVVTPLGIWAGSRVERALGRKDEEA